MNRANLTQAAADLSARALLDAVPAAIVVAGPAGDVLYANAAGVRLLGPGGSRLALSGAGGDAAPWTRACAGETVENERVTLERAHGPFSVALSARGASFGGRAACVIALSEVSEREADLFLSERRLAHVFLGSPLALSLGRFTSGALLKVNDKWLEFFGYRRDEVIGRSAHELGLWASSEERQKVRKLFQSGRNVRNAEVRLRRKDGSVRHALISFELVEPGPDPVALVSITDVTAGKEMRRSLDDVSRRLRLLVDTVEEYAIYLLDSEGRIVSWNPGAQRIHGYSEAEAAGKHISMFHEPEEVKKGGPFKLLAAAAEAGRSKMEGWCLRKDGSRFWADVVVTALRDESGALTGFAKITRDLTARRKAEEAEQLRRREEVQREVVANVSHELRTPIAAIRGFVETLLKGGLDDVKNRRVFVEIIDKHASHLSRLVEDILNLSSLDAGGTGAVERVRLKPFVEQALAGLAPLIKRRGLRVSCEVPAGLSSRLDPDRLGQVLGNLLGNAIKYNKPKGRVGVKAEAKGKFIEISVSDTGAGIPAAELPLLFERFRRTKAACQGKTKGTGLGLSIAKRIVEAWGGKIWAESGRSGSVFRFTVPRA